MTADNNVSLAEFISAEADDIALFSSFLLHSQRLILLSTDAGPK